MTADISIPPCLLLTLVTQLIFPAAVPASGTAADGGGGGYHKWTFVCKCASSGLYGDSSMELREDLWVNNLSTQSQWLEYVLHCVSSN